MTFRLFLIIMSLASLAAWVGWFIVLQSVDPTRSGTLGFLLFYLMLSTALVGTFSVLGVLGRIWRKTDELVVRICARSFRQSILLTGVIIGWLFLTGVEFLRWWTIVLLILIIAFIELIFLSMKKNNLEHKKYSS